MERITYTSVVGSVMYAMVCNRRDLAYAASVVSRFMSKPGLTHWESLKWLMRYLKGAAGTGLYFSKNTFKEEALVGYVDSDYAGSIDTRKSLTGFVFTLYGTTISLKSNLQSVVALSTTEAEYV